MKGAVPEGTAKGSFEVGARKISTIVTSAGFAAGQGGLKACGTCSLCCKLLRVRELNKPIDTLCRHATPDRGGCSIYPRRPSSCRGFICAWLTNRSLGDVWFPAHCKMILAQRVAPYSIAEQGLLVTVDPAYPSAWRREPYYSQLLAWARDFPIEIRIGRRCIGLSPDGTEEEVTKTGDWFDGT